MTTSSAGASPLIVVMGVAGSGKTSVGAALAGRMGLPFEDAEDLHTDANVAKLSAGVPLTDDDRAPWLRLVGEHLRAQERTGLVIACSALRRRYRDTIREFVPEVVFVHLDLRKDALASRLVMRSEHFRPLDLLQSQLAALEPLDTDEVGATFDASARIEVLVSRAEDAVRARAAQTQAVQKP